jgi:hypothetical protein
MHLSLDQRISWLFRLNAALNVALAIRGIIDPTGMTAMFGGPVPNYPFLIRLWMGLVFMFGLMFWETSRDVRKKAVLIKFNWIEKTITAGAVTLGFVAGDVPRGLMLLIVFTNWLWIPFILFADIQLRRDMHARARRERNAFRPGENSGSTRLASGSILE